MAGYHRTSARRLRLAGTSFTLMGLTLSLFLILGQLGIVAAGAGTTDRSRDGDFSSDTTVVSDQGGSGTERAGVGGGTTQAGSSGSAPSTTVTSDVDVALAVGDVTICHATGATNNPYNQITVNFNAGGLTAHLGHTGPVWNPSMTNQDTWGDIIPDVDDAGNPLPAGIGNLNWDALGQAIWRNGCNPVAILGAVAKTGPASVSVSSSGNTYTVTVANSGNGNATNVTISDDLPTGFSVTSVTWAKSNPTANGTCAATDPVSCNVGTLAPGQSVTVTITFSVGSAACPGPVANQAFVGGTGSNTVQTDVTNCPAAAAPDISIVKSGPTSIDTGDAFSYTLNVTNLGNAPALGVTVSDTVPVGLTITGSSTTAGTCGAAAGTLTCNLGDVPGGTTVTITVNVTHSGTSCAALSNTATVATTSLDDSDLTNHSSTANTTVTCSSNVTINKSGPATIGQGGTVTYTVTVTNNGTSGAPGLVITDVVDAALTGVQANIVGGVNNPACQVNSNTVTCTLGLAGSSQATITITGIAPTGTCPTITNQATGQQVLLNVTNLPPSGVVTTVVQGCAGGGGPGDPAISISKTASGPVQPGGSVSYTITVTSSGAVAAQGVTINDSLPSIPGTTWSISSGPSQGTCNLNGNSLSCNLGTLNSPPPTSVSVTVTSTATTTASCGTYLNTATAGAQGLTPVSASATASVQCPAGIRIVKSGPATAQVGDTIVYTMDVSLEDGSPSLPNVTVTDPVCDAAPTLQGGDANGNGVLDQGETWRFTCTHVVTDTDPDPLPNTATVCSGTVCGSDNHEIDLIHPAIALDKEGDRASASPGQVVTYTYDVTNVGDVPLSDVTVDDDVLGRICVIDSLAVGQTTRCVGTFTIPANAATAITNIAVAEGLYEAPTGASIARSAAALPAPRPSSVRDMDQFIITVVAGEVLAPTRTPPGGTAFTGPVAVIPLGALTLVLLTVGTGLLWAGRRRGRRSPQGSQG